MSRQGRWSAGRALVVAAAATAVVAAAACSLLMNWDPDGLACKDHTDCFTGYSCLINKCVRDGSLGVGKTCVLTKECDSEQHLICALFVCRKPCELGYQSAQADCDAGQYCRPVLNDKTQPCTQAEGCDKGTCQQLPDSGQYYCRFYEGACTESDDCREGITDTGTCTAAEVCVAMDTQTTVCVTPCELNWSTAAYDDNCANAGQLTFCQPIGQAGKERLVCLDSTSGAGGPGDACGDFLNQPCATGLGCYAGRCRVYCDQTTTDDVTPSPFCQAATANVDNICCGKNIVEPGDDFGVCLATCD